MQGIAQQEGYRLWAQFVPDPSSGAPSFIQTEGGLRHYRIVFGVRWEGRPAPAVVTYFLDPSYIDPIREVTDPTDAFGLRTTAYGDYVVRARLRTAEGVVAVQDSLARLLARSHGNDESPAVREAIESIRSH